MKGSKIRILAGLGLLIALCAGTQPAHAAGTVTFRVNTTLDGAAFDPENTVCTSAPTSPAHGLCSLRAAIETASNEAPGVNVTISVPSAAQHYDLTVSPGPLTVNKITSGTVSIVGAQRSGVVIDGSQYPGGTGDIQTFTSTLIRNVTITGGSGFSGGGIYMGSGNLSLDNVRITGNTGYEAGGLYQQGSGTLAITNAEIDHNTSSESLCSFSCSSPDGGGLHLAAGPVTMLYDDIKDNTTTGFGGGMYVSSVVDSFVHGSYLVITGNSAELNGGGIDAETFYGPADAPQMTLGNSVVENNSVETPSPLNPGGGGIENDTLLQLDNTKVANNQAGSFPSDLGVGGGIDNNYGGTLIMNGGSITGNRAGNEGGGLMNDYIATLNGVPVTGNHANDQSGDAGGSGVGGGIASVPFSTLHLVGGSVAGNGAGKFGGGIAAFTNDLEIDNATISQNLAGGTSGCPGFGGGLYMNAAGDVPPTHTLPNPGIHGGAVIGNSALDPTPMPGCVPYPSTPCLAQGGGVFIANATLTIDGGAHVDTNRSCSGGGIYLAPEGGLTFTGVDSLNVATGTGGAMYVGAGSLGATITSSRIVGNRAAQTGGIYNLAPVTVSSSLISGNLGGSTCLNLLSPCL